MLDSEAAASAIRPVSGRSLLVSLAAGAIVLAVYLPTVRYEFTNWDDRDYVTQNRLLRRPAGQFLKAVTTSLVPPNHGDFLPATLLSYWLEWQSVGRSPWLFHLDNVLLHAVSVGLVCLLGWRLTGSALAAALVALLFGLHPMNTEAVTWISERKSVLSMCLMLGCLHSMLTADRTARRRYWVLSVVLYGLACLSKTAVVFLPVVVAAYGLAIGRWKWRVLLWRVAPLACLALATAVGRLVAHQVSGQTPQSPDLDVVTHAATVLEIFGWYLCKMVAPVALSNYYVLRTSSSFTSPGVLFGLVALVFMLAAAAYTYRRQGLIFVGLIWYLAAWLPHSQIVIITPAMRADRYIYYSCVGLFLALVAAGLACYRRLRASPNGRLGELVWRVAVAPSCVVLVAAAGVGAACRNRVWTDSLTLWTDALRKNPRSFVSRNHIGAAYLELGQYDQAIVHLREVVGLKPDLGQAWSNLGRALLGAGQVSAAVDALTKAVAAEPENPRFMTALAEGYQAQGDLDGASELLTKAIAVDPNAPYSLYIQGTVLAEQGQIWAAVAALKRAIQLDPTDPKTPAKLGHVLLDAGQPRPAAVYLRQALELQPDLAPAHGNLALALLRQGSTTEAVASAARAVELDSQNHELLNNLATAMNAAGRFAQAVESYQRAISLAPDQPGGYNNLAWLLATCKDPAVRDGDRAVELAEQARRLAEAPGYEILDTLAAACAEAGDFARAVETQQRAVAAAPPPVREMLQGRLELYQAGRAYRQ